jgi:fructan beta-fructosidase
MRIGSWLSILVLSVAAVLLPAARPTLAGPPGDYPEFPYPASGYDEPHRGQFHFSPRAGWMNDVNAPLYHNGVYHLFFQHNPHGLQWDTMHWGHATSTDLVHWTQRPIALEPGVHPGDLFSGGGVVDTANTSGLRTGSQAPIVVFTGTNGVSVAYSNDGGRTFQPYAGGRKVFTMPMNSRDPKVLWHAPTRRWVLVVWSDAGGNAAHFYTSPNLLDWTFRSRYAADWLFECPDLFALRTDGDGALRWILNDAAGRYVVGSFDGATFRTDAPEPRPMDAGDAGFTGSFYAGLTFTGLPGDRVVQMAWMPGNRGNVWTGSTTVPVELGLRSYPGGPRLTRTPVAELAALRGAPRTVTDRVLTGDPAADPLGGVTADTYEVIAEFDTAGATATRFGIRLGVRPDGLQQRAATYDLRTRTLNGEPLPPDGGRVRMRMLVDRGQLELFGGDGQVSITEAVAFDPAGRGVRTFAEGGGVRLVSLRLYPLASAWGRGEATLESNLRGAWRTAGGAWTDVAAGKRGDAPGDGFYLSGQSAADLSAEADVRLDTATAAGLTVRASADATGHYTVNVDANGFVKLWRPGRDIAVHPVPVVRGRTYHLRLVATGPRLSVYLDHGATPVIDAVDATHTGGLIGVNVFAGAAVVQNANLGGPGFRTNLGDAWRPVTGSWTTTGAGAQGRQTGDGFYLSSRGGRDFTYEADLRVVTGRAAALTFRSDAGATAHYSAGIDTDGVVKLWRPGRDIAVAAAPIVPGRTYHLAVVAAGPRIAVYLDRAPTPVIDVVDATYVDGYFGINVFDGGAVVQNVMVR